MSEFQLTDFIEEFCTHAIYVDEDGRSKLQDLLGKTQKSIATIVTELLASNHYELTSLFLKKVVRYPTECVVFLTSPEVGEVCDSVTAVRGQYSMKVAFVQLFLSVTLSNVHSCTGIISPAISWMASESLELSDCCGKVLAMLAKADEALAADILGHIMSQLTVVQDDSTIHLRYLCLLSSLMKISSEYFTLCESKGAAAVVIFSCQNPDILLQTISLDFLVDISSSRAGATHLYTHGQVQWLVAMGGGVGGEAFLDQSQGHAVEDFLVVQAISCAAKVLKNIEHLAPHLLYDYISTSTALPLATVLTQLSADSDPVISVFISGLLQLLEHPDEAERLACLEAIATYATSSPRAFLMLLSSDRLIVAWLDLLRKQPSIQASTLHSIAQVLLYPAVLGDDSPDAPFVREVNPLPGFAALSPAQFSEVLIELDATKRKIFGQICLQLGTSKYQSTMEYLVKLARGPIDELKHAAYDVLRALAYQIQTWGVHTLFEYTAFYPFLLDRSTEHGKTGKDWKFSLLQGLHHTPHIELLTEAIPTRIQDMIQEGAYFIPPEVAGPVTMEL